MRVDEYFSSSLKMKNIFNINEKKKVKEKNTKKYIKRIIPRRIEHELKKLVR